MPDREKYIEVLSKTAKTVKEFNEDTPIKISLECVEDILELLKKQEDDKPKGHWMPYEPDKRGYTDGFTCSRCERVILSDHYCKMIDFDFCPYCGAYMDNAEGR